MSDINNFMNWGSPGTALITGASSGIGAEFARQLAMQGFSLILVARRKEKLEVLSKELQTQYSINAEVLVADLTISEDIKLVENKISSTENLDVLINNAGFGYFKTFLDLDSKAHIDMISVHLTSPILFVHSALPKMIKRKRGVVINVSSMAAFLSKSPMYSMTKAAIAMFTQLIKTQIKQRKIFFQALCPGFIYTEFHDTETMKGFNREPFPKELWMTAEEVVSLSLENVKSRKTIFIPGEVNQKRAAGEREKNLKKYLDCKII